jgi:hypothetical protein
MQIPRFFSRNFNKLWTIWRFHSIDHLYSYLRFFSRLSMFLCIFARLFLVAWMCETLICSCTVSCVHFLQLIFLRESSVNSVSSCSLSFKDQKLMLHVENVLRQRTRVVWKLEIQLAIVYFPLQFRYNRSLVVRWEERMGFGSTSLRRHFPLVCQT